MSDLPRHLRYLTPPTLPAAEPPYVPRQVTAWMIAPALEGRPDLAMALVAGLVALLRPLEVHPIYTGEPRYYRWTEQGRASLSGALEARRASVLVIVAGEIVQRGSGGGANVTLVLGATFHVAPAATIGIRLWPDEDDSLQPLAMKVAEFIKQWFAPLDARAAFVSTSGTHSYGDDPSGTIHERSRPSPIAIIGTNLHATERFARGAFWGNGLGASLCERLGGQQAVLRDAPVFRAEPLDTGVWVQLTEAFPPDEASVTRLANYLASLLEWTASDVPPIETKPPPRQRRQRKMPAPTIGIGDSVQESEPIPIRGYYAIEGLDIPINIYLEQPATPEQEHTIRSLLAEWYEQGFDGAFGGEGFHALSEPVIDGTVVRCMLDVGFANAVEALNALARRLAALPEIRAREIILEIDTAE